MSAYSKLALLPVSLLGGVCLLITTVQVAADPKEETPPQAIYDKDRGHLWNRVHAALFIRTGPDGRSYGEDRLEPLLWKDTEHLLTGKSAARAVAVLDEFLRETGESLIDDPLKRAILQRDLWLVANWLAEKPRTDAQERFEALLAKVIRRLALSPDQIATLPDNYAAAVASKEYADTFDPEKPEQAYLPPDLFQPGGPWACVGRTDGPTAPRHLREDGTNRFTNSAFLVFLKLPGGRDATLDFLKRLAAFDEPLLLPNLDEKSKRSFPYLPNPALPQWPKGTEVALVRRALLIDSSRKIVASPLTESVQLRVMRTDTPAPTAETLEKADPRRGTNRQAFAEFQLRRGALFAGEAGGLRDASGERDFKTGFNAHPWDEFGERRSPASTAGPFPRRSQPFENNRASCIGCHRLPGVYSFNSLQDFHFASIRSRRDEDGEGPKPPSLIAMTVEEVEQAAIKWKEAQPGWVELRKLLPE